MYNVHSTLGVSCENVAFLERLLLVWADPEVGPGRMGAAARTAAGSGARTGMGERRGEDWATPHRRQD